MELQLTPSEAYTHIQKIIEELNAFLASLHSSEVLKKRDSDALVESKGTIEEEKVTGYDYQVRLLRPTITIGEAAGRRCR